MSSLTADFIPSVRIFNNQAFVTLINTSRFASTFEWTIESGSPETSTLRFPQVVYTSNGTFNVTLVAKRGADSETVTKQIVVTGIEGGGDVVDNGNEEEQAEVLQSNARFTAFVRNVNNQAQVTFTNRSENATDFQWSFPGGTPSTSTLENPTVVYPRNGSFTITLTASNEDNSDTTTQTISINNIPDTVEEPAADVRASFFVSVRRVNGEFQLTMRNRSRNATDFQWSFPGADPATSTLENPVVTYTERGIKTITLVASNGDVSSTRRVSVRL